MELSLQMPNIRLAGAPAMQAQATGSKRALGTDPTENPRPRRSDGR